MALLSYGGSAMGECCASVNTLPRLSRKLLWVDKPGSADKIFKTLAVVCAVLFLADFAYHKHIYVAVEKIPGFYGIFGFVMFAGLVIAAKMLRVAIRRPDDYYAPNAIDAEEYPEDELEKVDHDAT